jgi:ABC-type multidrug transport system ATPase subunit
VKVRTATTHAHTWKLAIDTVLLPYLPFLPHVLLQGLDPASRRNLWDVVKSNKRDRAIVLTTHSMEEAEMLCDRLGIFVDGRLVCIGNPKEITSRYGGFLVRGDGGRYDTLGHENREGKCAGSAV